MLRGTIKIRVQAVLRLCDSFTESPVDPSMIRIRLPQGGEAVKKEGGLFVLIHCPPTPFFAAIESPFYEKVNLEIHPDEGEAAGEVKTCYLIRSQAMPMPEDTTYLEGRGQPGDKIMVYLKAASFTMRLLEDYKKEDGKTIKIYHPPASRLEGARLFIENRDKKGEMMQVERDMGDGKYRLETPLSKSYKKAGTSLYLVREGFCRPDGNFSIPFRQVSRTGAACGVIFPDGSQIETELCFGERNRLN